MLEAAIRCLETLGYARTTTTEVCRLAGVSQGALFKHFATKTALLNAAATTLFAALADDLERRFARLPRTGNQLGAAVDLLWATFETPRLQASFELYVAARTDPDLARGLESAVAAHQRGLRHVFGQLLADSGAESEYVNSAADLLIVAGQGVALENLCQRRTNRQALLDIAGDFLRQATTGARASTSAPKPRQA